MEKTITITYDSVVKASLKSGDTAALLSCLVTIPYGPGKEGEAKKTVSIIYEKFPPEVITPVTAALKGVLDWIAKQPEAFDEAMAKSNEAAAVDKAQTQAQTTTTSKK